MAKRAKPKTATKKRPAREAADPILRATDLVKVYDGGGTVTRALDGVSLDVPEGSFTVVMGPSGSGKSTLLHLLGGLDSPTSGDVFLRDQKLSAMDDRDLTLARRRSIGFVFQFFNLVPVLTVRENIALPFVIDGRSPGDYRERLDQLIVDLGLEDCVDKLPEEISGGQQQRTAIARALLPEPAVLLADEPTGNLDRKTGLEVLRSLQRTQQETGQTIVAVTHDATAAAFGEEIVYITDGRITGTMRPDGRRRRGGDDRAQAVLAWLQELEA